MEDYLFCPGAHSLIEWIDFIGTQDVNSLYRLDIKPMWAVSFMKIFLILAMLSWALLKLFNI